MTPPRPKKAKAALPRPELRYRRLFESSPDGILLLDFETRAITDSNLCIEKLLGYTHDELIGKELWEIGLPEDREASESAFRHLREAGYLRYEDLPLRTRNGARREVEFISTVFDDGKGRVIQCNIRDRTDHKRVQDAALAQLRASEKALRESEERLRALLEKSSDVITVLAPDATILYESPSAAAILGYLPSELVGTNALTPVHADDRPKVVEAINHLAMGGEFPDPLTYRYLHKDGTWRWLESKGNNQIHNPSIAGIVANSRDVTERRRLEQQVIHTAKLAALGELVAGVAHEINNPLAAISGHAQLLARHPDSAVREDASVIITMVQRANRIVRSLRSYASPSSGDQRSRSDLNGVVRSALTVVGSRLRQSDVVVEEKLLPGLPAVTMNAGEIEQVIVNLLSNAEQAVREKSLDWRFIRITTTFRQTEMGDGELPCDCCVLEVQDSGGGITNETLPRIFDPFFTTREQGEGTGLGLYISHGIITAHGGWITAESQEGVGTTFTVTFPPESSEERHQG